MSKHIPYKLELVKMRMGKNTLTFPYFVPNVFEINVELDSFAKRYTQIIQEQLVNQEEYLTTVQYELDAEIQHTKISIEIPESVDNLRYVPMETTYDLLYWNIYKDQFHGYIPVLGVEATAVNVRTLFERIKESVQLEWYRSNRFKYPARIIETQWFKNFKPQSKSTNLVIYTKAELEKLYEDPARLLINKILNECKIPSKQTFGMDKELEELYTHTVSNSFQSILVVGPSGSGKTVFLYELIKKLKQTYTEYYFKEITASKLIRGLTEDIGWQSSLAKLINELRVKNHFIYFGNWAEYFEIGQYIGNNVSVGEALREAIQRNYITILTECTEEELVIFESRFPGYSNAFHIVKFREKSKEELKKIILDTVHNLSEKANIKITEESILELIDLHRRFFPYSGFPGKSIQFMESLLLAEKQKENLLIASKVILDSFSMESGIPSFMIDSETPLITNQIQDFFQKRIFGQKEAIHSITNTILSIKANLSRGNKPIATLLFAGPTGVGKTELAKCLAEFMFGNPAKMIRLDMSEYSNPNSVFQLTDEFNSGNSLVSKIRQSNFSVVLFDEIEKAHPVIFDLFLQILGEGRLTNAKGEVANFCSSIIILTSNLGAREVSKTNLGFEKEDRVDSLQSSYKRVIESTFRPELVNRIDEIVIFSSLEEENYLSIINRELQNLHSRIGFSNRKINIQIPEETKIQLKKEIHNSKYGARQIKRVIQKFITYSYAKALNHYTPKDAIQISFLQIPETGIQVEYKSKPTGTDSELEELLKKLNLVTDLRRTVQKIKSAYSYISIQNTLDQQHERILEKLEMNQYAKDSHAVFLHSLVKIGETLEIDIRKVEEELYLDFHNNQTSRNYISINVCLSTFYQWIEELYAEAFDDYVCCMGIYGDKDDILDLLKIYRKELFPPRKLSTRVRILFKDGVTKKEVEHSDLWSLSFAGIELELKGLAVTCFLETQTGFYKAKPKKKEELKKEKEKEKEKERYVFVTVSQGSFLHFDTPKDVHRKHFFKDADPKNAKEMNFEYTIEFVTLVRKKIISRLLDIESD